MCRRPMVLTTSAAACTGAMSALASENIPAIGNAAYNNTVISMREDVTAGGGTAHGSGLGSGLIQLPVDRASSPVAR